MFSQCFALAELLILSIPVCRWCTCQSVNTGNHIVSRIPIISHLCMLLMLALCMHEQQGYAYGRVGLCTCACMYIKRGSLITMPGDSFREKIWKHSINPLIMIDAKWRHAV